MCEQEMSTCTEDQRMCCANHSRSLMILRMLADAKAFWFLYPFGVWRFIEVQETSRLSSTRAVLVGV
jgi:hypothetical protein